MGATPITDSRERKIITQIYVKGITTDSPNPTKDSCTSSNGGKSSKWHKTSGQGLRKVPGPVDTLSQTWTTNRAHNLHTENKEVL